MIYTPNAEPGQFPHQARDLERMWNWPGFAWWWEQGTGKSREFIDNGGMLYCDKAVDAWFMLAPNGLHRNFVTQQLKQHLPPDLKEKTRALFWHNDKAKTKAWQNQARDFMSWKGLKVLSMSYDAVLTDLGKKLANEFLLGNRCLYGCDESQRISNPDAARTKAVLGSSRFAPFRRAMTGTPIANAPWDCWSQIKFVNSEFWKPKGLDSIEAMKSAFGEWDRGARRVPIGQASRQKSLDTYYAKNGTPPELQTFYKVDKGAAFMLFPKLAADDDGRPIYRNLDRLREMVAPIRSRVLKKDVFPDLPEKIHTPLDFDMSPAQRRAYDSLVNMGFAITDDGQTCSATMALTLLLRLQQVACGYLVTDLDASRYNPNDEDPRIQAITPNPRLELLKEICTDLNHPTLIWARFTPDVDAICDMLKKLGKTVARYDGAISDDECAENEERFHRGEAQFFVSKASKGGEGLTLVEAKTAIFYSYSYKLIEYQQASDRPHRYGQDNRVNEIMFKARNSCEGKIVNALQAKMEMAGAITGDVVRKFLVPEAQGELFEVG